jgi:hypothetical protein
MISFHFRWVICVLDLVRHCLELYLDYSNTPIAAAHFLFASSLSSPPGGAYDVAAGTLHELAIHC